MPVSAIEPSEGGVLIRVKAVPGARSDRVVGPLGDRVKIRTSAPPEGGKANRAIAGLLARALGLRSRDVRIVTGHGSAEKTFEAEGVGVEEAALRLGIIPG